MTNLMPKPLLSATTNNWTLGHLYLELDTEDWVKEHHEPGTWLLGHILPPFQRPVVWTEPQMIRFIESAWLGLHLGVYVYNDASDFAKLGSRRPKTDLWLIDGQQRLTALERYFRCQFPVFGHLWTDLGREEQRRLLRSVTFAGAAVKSNDEAMLRELYDRLNFGGTPHSQDQRAVRPSDLA